MTKLLVALLSGVFALASAAADAQTSMRVRGTITAVDGNVLSVKSRDGKDLKLQVTDKTTVAAAKAITLAELKPGQYVGSATMKRPDGTLVAIEVHTIAPTVPEGHIAWDLQPGSMMTNANVAAVVQVAGGQELTLEYKGGSQKILVPDGVPIVTTVPADRSLLVPGAYVFIPAQVAPDGTMTAPRIQVSKDGVKPPQ